MYLIRPSYVIKNKIDADAIMEFIEEVARTCYKSECRIAPGSAKELIKNILSESKKHESVIEHSHITVKFIIDRGVSHELVRHRLASYSQESTRYCNYGKKGVQFVIPPWITDIEPGEYPLETHIFEMGIDELPLPFAMWFMSMREAARNYLGLLTLGWTPQQARAVLPNSLKTEIVMTANLREWRHVLRLRTAKNAHPQMREVMVPLLAEFKANLPVLFDDIEVK